MTIKQGNLINREFDKLKVVNNSLVDSVTILQNKLNVMNDSTFKLTRTIDTLIAISDNYKFMYTENKKIYLQRETEYRKENRRHTIRYLVLCFVILFQVVITK